MMDFINEVRNTAVNLIIGFKDKQRHTCKQIGVGFMKAVFKNAFDAQFIMAHIKILSQQWCKIG
jgi:hypothetical protein